MSENASTQSHGESVSGGCSVGSVNLFHHRDTEDTEKNFLTADQR